MVAPLHRADGSATSEINGYTVLGAVNGPLQIQSRDELPEDAAIEVHIRPATGLGTTRERYLESIIQSTLKRVILTRQFPRTLIQVTLQVLSAPDESNEKLAGVSPTSSLPLLPSLLQSALMSLMSAAIPMQTTYATVTKSLDKSYHVFTYSGEGKLIVAESEGDFGLQEWNSLSEAAEKECAGAIERMRKEWKR